MLRRQFLLGLGSMLAAPAIVHAGNLMPIRAPKPEIPEWFLRREFITFDCDFTGTITEFSILISETPDFLSEHLVAKFTLANGETHTIPARFAS